MISKPEYCLPLARLPLAACIRVHRNYLTQKLPKDLKLLNNKKQLPTSYEEGDSHNEIYISLQLQIVPLQENVALIVIIQLGRTKSSF